MAPEHLESVKKILDQALELDTAERPAFVERACADNPSVKREVESLLEEDAAAKSWTEGPLLRLAPRNGTDLEPEQRIGPYRIIRILGRGGMGAVALAEREDDFTKRVALKVVRPGPISDELVARFHNERQILAQLEHPNIARILDGGTTPEGLPFFVMEYVEGEPIDVYCHSRKLSIRQRLKLFLQICSALSRAHGNLVAHRDLKPINILVDGEGVLKLLDFGIAKQIEPESDDELTRPENARMTLRYASPEQVDGRAITTSTDIYSLGVLLYQLLTDHYPYGARGENRETLLKAIQEAAPGPPSAAVEDRRLRKELSGDLDAIVLKAMSKDPADRYGSVDQLAEDIRRYLEWHPVAARQSTWGYRTAKFVRRYRLPLAAAAALATLIIASAITTTILWRQALHQEQIALLERDRSREVLEFMKSLFRGSDLREAMATGKEVTVRQILARGEQTIDERFADDPLSQAELLGTIGKVYTDLGLFDAAEAPWERAEYLLRRQYPDGHTALAKAINNRASWFYRTGDYDSAEVLYREALQMKLDLPRDDADRVLYMGLINARSNLATILVHRGEFEEAEHLYLQALKAREEEFGSDHLRVALTLRSLGVLYYTWGDLERAAPLLRESLETRLRIDDPEGTRVATALGSLGRLRQAQQRHEEAEELLLRALDIRVHRLGEEHPHVALTRLDLARLYLDTGELEKGQDLLDRSLAVLRADGPADSWKIADAESVLGGYLTRQGRYMEAEAYLAKSYDSLARIRGERAIYTRNAQQRLRELREIWGAATVASR